MIHDHLDNSCRYESIHSRFKTAFDFLKSTNLREAPIGRIDIDGDNIFAMISVVEGKMPDNSLLEAHRRYIDIQVPIDATETIGWASTSILSKIAKEYDISKDILFYQEKATDFVTSLPMEFTVFFPEDAHQPGIANGKVKKVVVKILL